MRIIMVIIIILAVPTLAHAATLKVPSQYPTIQGAIDASVNGDTVLVAPDTYIENITFKGKAISVESAGGPEITIIDGNMANTVVTFSSGETSDSILQGFTITNGVSMAGGGIQCLKASPTIRNNLIVGNNGVMSGGMFMDNSSPMITGNAIIKNYTMTYGGGIWCYASSPVIMNNLIAENLAERSLGGGMLCYDSAFTIENTTFYGNKAPDSKYGWGGGIAIGWSDDDAVHFTSTLTITNSIFWKNEAAVGPQIWIGETDNPSTLHIRYSDVEGGAASVHIEPGCTLDWGLGMIDQDPLFVDPLNGDFCLQQDPCQPGITNPCVDAGDNMALNLGLSGCWTRSDGVPDSGMADMGYHYGFFSYPALRTNGFSVPESTGGSVHLLLHGGVENASRQYIVLGSVSGMEPGTMLPGGKAKLPLNWDFFTNVVIDHLNSWYFFKFMGKLDKAGSTIARFDTMGPIPGTAGLKLHFAYALDNPWDFASNPVGIEIVP